MASNGTLQQAVEKQAEMQRRLKGRTPDQQAVIKYFYGDCGSLLFKLLGKKGLSDQEYESMVMKKAKSMDFKERALDQIGLDESQVNEVEPIHFEAYFYDSNQSNYARRGEDGLWRSSAYQITWLFFSDTQLYVYQYIFDMTDDSKKESTEEFFYKDITNVSSSSDTIDKEVPVVAGCLGNTVYERSTVDMNRFKIVVPGEKRYCSIKQSDYTDQAIRGMKHKIKEKKESQG